jgi:hypothetical protein
MTFPLAVAQRSSRKPREEIPHPSRPADDFAGAARTSSCSPMKSCSLMPRPWRWGSSCFPGEATRTGAAAPRAMPLSPICGAEWRGADACTASTHRGTNDSNGARGLGLVIQLCRLNAGGASRASLGPLHTVGAARTACSRAGGSQGG